MAKIAFTHTVDRNKRRLFPGDLVMIWSGIWKGEVAIVTHDFCDGSVELDRTDGTDRRIKSGWRLERLGSSSTQDPLWDVGL